MSSGKCHSFVQEEQFRIAPFRHHDPLPPFERENTSDPAPAFEIADDFPITVVKNSASVAHHRSTSRRSKQFAERANAILERHPKTLNRSSCHTLGYKLVHRTRKSLRDPVEIRRAPWILLFLATRRAMGPSVLGRPPLK
jgi:hypothetical protein